ncbi:ScbA/BarX family gamma-butyrolactone biosynthesis protein [Streptomyces sp. NPDC002667]|uniref:ScbA/BarX family gamma-butyrolactone biosynthesis protein n=1 Tax=Streptomyces sp. NPDC002667 TaxID=3364657 RepID=UPI00367D120A
MSLTDPPPALPAPDHTSHRGGRSHLRTAPRRPADPGAITGVLITDWQQTGTDTFVLGAQWPRGHAFYTPIAGVWHDPLLAAESLRQASLLVGRSYDGIPRGHRWAVSELDIEVAPAGLLAHHRPSTFQLEMARVPDPAPGAGTAPGTGGVTAMTMEAELLRDDDTFVGAGRIGLRILPPTARTHPHAIRPGPPTGPPLLPRALPPPVVGRLNTRDVTLGIPATRSEQGVHVWQLRIDPTHPALPDEPTGHIPVMLLLEAARQAAQAVSTPYRVLPIEIRSTFHHPVELHSPCTITATPLRQYDATEETAVRVTGTQNGVQAFDSLIVTTPTD